MAHIMLIWSLRQEVRNSHKMILEWRITNTTAVLKAIGVEFEVDQMQNLRV